MYGPIAVIDSFIIDLSPCHLYQGKPSSTWQRQISMLFLQENFPKYNSFVSNNSGKRENEKLLVD